MDTGDIFIKRFKVKYRTFIFKVFYPFTGLPSVVFFPLGLKIINEWGDKEDVTKLLEENHGLETMRAVLKIFEEYVFGHKPFAFQIRMATDKLEKRYHLYERLINRTKVSKYYTFCKTDGIIFFYRNKDFVNI